MTHAGTGSGRVQSALLVPVPDAEPLVERWRLAHDPVASEGVPAHITLVVPWLPPDRIGEGDLAALAEVLAGVPPWDFLLTRVGWFGTRVLWLAPEPAEPFVRLTHALAERFATPPWENEFDEVVPHLTVGHADAGAGPPLDEAAAALGAHLPVKCRAEEVWVMVGDGARWTVRTRVGLG